ncbi:IclR family transcriptional regulator [Longispora sp. K20-0274]|uniref:IclR family transcriptional regulator n=1 Tax=Longispora sp. K20-0274 TaxID=3088255 RepID=UPI00399C3012
MSQSLSRALKLLVELGHRPCSLDDAARVLDVHKTTALRLLRTLEEERFVYRDPAFRYHLGSQFFALATVALDQRQVREAAGPHLTALCATTGQTVHLAGYEDGHVIYWDKRESQSTVRMYSRIGLPASPHTAAVAKVLLAGLDEAERRRVVAGIAFTRHTPRTLAGPAELLAELATVAERGYAVDHGEHEAFMNCVAAPVRGAGGRVTAAVSISVPDFVLDYEHVLALVPDLLGTARAISIDCGWSAP